MIGSKILAKSLYVALFSGYKHFLCVTFFAINSKIQNGRHFCYSAVILQVKKFVDIALSSTVFEILEILSLLRYPVGQKFCPNCSISHGFRDISTFCVTFFAINSKIQNGRHFCYSAVILQVKKFVDIALSSTVFEILEILSLLRYPVGQKFCPNCSISHGFRDISIFVFCDFCDKFENSKWPPFLPLSSYPAGQNFWSKSLYLAQFSRYSRF